MLKEIGQKRCGVFSKVFKLAGNVLSIDLRLISGLSPSEMWSKSDNFATQKELKRSQRKC